MLIQLNPPIQLITPAGFVEATVFENPGADEFCLFHGFNEKGIWVSVQSTEVRAIGNVTYDKPKIPLEKLFKPEQLNRWKFARDWDFI